jgi:hypothetical protein
MSGHCAAQGNLPLCQIGIFLPALTFESSLHVRRAVSALFFTHHNRDKNENCPLRNGHNYLPVYSSFAEKNVYGPSKHKEKDRARN